MIVLVHGGAGRYRPEIEERREVILRELSSAAVVGVETLRTGNALDAVVEAITYMESCGEFNAGKGAVLNIRGELELDAGLMWGPRMEIGAVGGLKGYWNAIKLARFILEETDHILVTGEGANIIAEKIGLEKASPSKRRIQFFPKIRERTLKGKYWWRKNLEIYNLLGYSTVGAVALDKEGNLAAGASTGGIWLKLPGRLGDTPIPGAGFYADNVCAASATGLGEAIMRALLTFRACRNIALGLNIKEAAREAIKVLTLISGPNTGGIILLDSRGNYSFAANTEILLRAIAKEGEKPKAAIKTSEKLVAIK